jgi:hypothetical protein
MSMNKNTASGASATAAFDTLMCQGFDVQYVSHARAILEVDFPGAFRELVEVLEQVSLPITEIIGSGGGETKFTQRLRKHFAALGWAKHEFGRDLARPILELPGWVRQYGAELASFDEPG